LSRLREVWSSNHSWINLTLYCKHIADGTTAKIAMLGGAVMRACATYLLHA